MIEIRFEKENRQATAYDNNVQIGKCNYSETETEWNIIHTRVSNLYQGHGIARKLVECIQENALKHNKDVIAECSYAKKVIEKNQKTKEYEFYNKLKDWDFSKIKYEEECLTKWDMYDILSNCCNSQSKILDLGTGGGEKVLTKFPDVSEILATDFSEEMIKTANDKLKQSNKTNITFRKMDNLNMDTPNDYFDVIVARHTCIDAKQIHKTLKTNGILILRGVDKLDCWELKKMYGKGQGYNESQPISFRDYENILEAGFKEVELVPIHVREYYKSKEDLLALLVKAPILEDFSGVSDKEQMINKIDKYIEMHTTDRGILLIRRYYGITARK